MGRVLMSYFAGVYVRMITGMKIMDPTGGFICYRREVLKTIPLDKITFIGYAFQIEMKFNAFLYKFNIKEVPIIFTDRTKGVSKMSSKIFQEAIFGVIMMKIWSWFKRFER
jgi:dolichol-phosphate mannosyltransferase